MTEEYRYVFPRVIAAMTGVAIMVCATVVPVAIVADETFPRWGAVVLAVAALLGGWRGATVRAAADDKRILVRNIFRTCRIRWADVTRVHVRMSWWSRYYGSYACLHVRGRLWPVQVLATFHTGLEQSARDRRIMAAIREWKDR